MTTDTRFIVRMTTDTRFIVRDGLGAADDGSGPPAEWWVYRQWLADVSEYEPGFPVLNEDWRDDDSFEPILFRVETDAIATVNRLNQTKTTRSKT